MNLLEVRDLQKNFGGLAALSGLNLTVRPGEILGIIGPNGAGKTTLFNCITGFLGFDGGQVQLEGHDLAGKKPHQIVNLGLTRTWQLVKPFFGMRVRQALQVATFCRRACQLEDGNSGARLERVAAQLGLADRLDDQVDNLNQGELRLLDIARAVVTDPRILFLDEPFSGLSQREITNISEVVKGLNQQGLTAVIIEHRLRELMKLVDRVFVINFGRNLAEGTPADVVANPEVVEAYLGRKGGAFVLA